MKDSSLSSAGRSANNTLPGQVVLVLQGGGKSGRKSAGGHDMFHGDRPAKSATATQIAKR